MMKYLGTVLRHLCMMHPHRTMSNKKTNRTEGRLEKMHGYTGQGRLGVGHAQRVAGLLRAQAQAAVLQLVCAGGAWPATPKDLPQLQDLEALGFSNLKPPSTSASLQGWQQQQEELAGRQRQWPRSAANPTAPARCSHSTSHLNGRGAAHTTRARAPGSCPHFSPEPASPPGVAAGQLAPAGHVHCSRPTGPCWPPRPLQPPYRPPLATTSTAAACPRGRPPPEPPARTSKPQALSLESPHPPLLAPAPSPPVQPHAKEVEQRLGVGHELQPLIVVKHGIAGGHLILLHSEHGEHTQDQHIEQECVVT